MRLRPVALLVLAPAIAIAIVPLTVTLLAACSAAPATTNRAPSGSPDEDSYENADPTTGRLPPAATPDYVNEDAGVFGPGDRRADAAPPRTSPGPDAAPTPLPRCAGPVAAGDLLVVELMVQTAAGAGDRGEWVEIKSTRDCALSLRGVRVSSPRGDAGADGVDLPGDVTLAPHGTFVVTGGDATRDALSATGLVFSFTGSPADILKNDGDSVVVTAGSVVVDTLTYPRFTGFRVGRSMSFPASCAPADRASFARWSYSFAAYGGLLSTLKGTPNQDNADVACY